METTLDTPCKYCLWRSPTRMINSYVQEWQPGLSQHSIRDSDLVSFPDLSLSCLTQVHPC